MAISKWKRPSNDGDDNGTPAVYSPFTNLLENFFNDSFLSREFSNFVPAVNVAEDDDSYSVELSAPGFRKEDFKVELDNKTLTVSASHREAKEEGGEKKTFRRKEFNYGSFRRVFSLPETVNEENIEANYENGILRLRLSKKEEAKAKPAREIKIS